MSNFHADITGLNGDYAQMLLWPYMVHPNDEDRRERLGDWLCATIALDSGELDLSKETQRRLIEAAGARICDDIPNATAGGCMAGDVLFALLGMAEGNVTDGGSDKACHVVSTLYESLADGSGKRFKAGRDTVRNNWRKYRNVAHLWAAHMIMLRDAEGNSIRDDPSKWLDGCKLADIAHSLQATAARFALPRSGEPILPPAALKIVGASIVPVSLPPPLAPVFGALDSFVARFR